MAIKELFTTRRTRETAGGANMWRTFQMTFAEYDGTFDIFIGNKLGDSALLDGGGSGISGVTKLRVIDIEQNGIDNVNTNVTVTY